jgi:hypothetical protein
MKCSLSEEFGQNYKENLLFDFFYLLLPQPKRDFPVSKTNQRLILSA